MYMVIISFFQTNDKCFLKIFFRFLKKVINSAENEIKKRNYQPFTPMQLQYVPNIQSGFSCDRRAAAPLNYKIDFRSEVALAALAGRQHLLIR